MDTPPLGKMLPTCCFWQESIPVAREAGKGAERLPLCTPGSALSIHPTRHGVSAGTPRLCHVCVCPQNNTHFCRNSSKPQILSTKSSTSTACSSSCV